MYLQEPQAIGTGTGRTRAPHQPCFCGHPAQGIRIRLARQSKDAEGIDHPDRDAQFQYIQEKTLQALDAGQPVISVDTKKKELVGNYKNAGQEWRPQGEPEAVQVYDFVDTELGRTNPYGAYDLAQNAGWVSVGMCANAQSPLKICTIIENV